jgi:hypothetical protein
MPRDPRRGATTVMQRAPSMLEWPPGREVGPIRALIFYLDEAVSVCSSRAIDFTSREDLARQLEPDRDHYPVIEAWIECVCLLRLRADAPPEWRP